MAAAAPPPKPMRPLSSNFSRWRTEILTGFAVLSLVYLVTYKFVVFSSSSTSTLFQPAPQFCHDHLSNENNKTCSRPDLFAFQVAGFVTQLFLGLTGLFAWHFPKHPPPETPEGRLFGYVPAADRLNAGIFIYQVWDFVFSIMIPEHATIVFLGHHLAAALTAYFSLEYQMCHYYAQFFGGCTEVSTIFLVFCDFDVYFPAPNRGSIWGLFILFCQVAFVITFVAYRVIGWWIVSYQLWKDALFAMRKGTAKTYRSAAWFLYIFLAMDVVLGLLQVYWFVFGMLPKIVEILEG